MASIKGNNVRITFTFAEAPASATARVAPTLYNKARVLQFEQDDAPLSTFTDLYPLLQGGVGSNGQRYPGLHFSDGCGHTQPYTAAVAINGHNPYNNAIVLDAGPMHDSNRLVWPQAQELLDHGWDVENHSDLHTADNPVQQVAVLDALIADRLHGYRPVVHVVPTNFAGYCTAAFAAGYIAVSSASQADQLPMFGPYNANRVPLSTLPDPNTPFVYQRYQADLDAGGGEADWHFLNRLKGLSDALLASGPDEVYLQRVFSHGMDPGILANWLTYTQDIAQDRLWVTTLREFAEYRRARAQVVVAQTLNGNTLTVDLDYGNLDPTTRFQNLTLLVDAPGTVTNIAVDGADSNSSNLAAKLVNVFRKAGSVGTAGTSPAPAPAPVPAPAPAPTTYGDCAGTGSLLREQWSNVQGASLSDIPLGTAPSSSAALTQFEAVDQFGFNYAARLRGYICPPQSGTYTFWIGGDDQAELYLSTSDQPANAQRIASCTTWTASAHEFYRYASQQSAPVQLVAGQRYYVEALHKQEWGPGYLAVAWRLPDGTTQDPIPGSALIPFDPSGANSSIEGSTASASATMLNDAQAATGTANHSELSVYPNPFSTRDGRARVQMRVAKTGPATLVLYDLQGRLVHRLFAGTLEAGVPRTVALEAPGLNNGLYLVRLVTPSEVINKKVVCTAD